MKYGTLFFLFVGLLCAGTPVQIESIYATSTATSGTSFSVPHLFDGDSTTLWQTAHGSGPEEGIMIYFKTPVVINGLEFQNMKRDKSHTYSYRTYINGSKKDIKYNRQKVRSLFIKFYGHPYSSFTLQGKSGDYTLSSSTVQKSVSIGEIRLLKGGLPYKLQLPTLLKTDLKASSTLKPHSAYGVHNLFDARKEFTWCEGVEGDGRGETLSFTFSSKQKISGLRIWNGYQRSMKHFKANGRVKKFAISDGTVTQFVSLKDTYGVQEVRFDTPLHAQRLLLEIAEVYPGAKYADLCISELSFLQGDSIVKVDNTQFQQQKRERCENSYHNTLLGTLLNKVVTKRHIADGENDFDEKVTLILRSDNTFVYYSDFGDASSGDTKSIVADGNWSFVSEGNSSQTIKLFGQWLNISEISEVYTGTTKSSYQRIFQDRITLSKKVYEATREQGPFKAKGANSNNGTKPFNRTIIELSGGKFLSPLYYDAQ